MSDSPFRLRAQSIPIGDSRLKAESIDIDILAAAAGAAGEAPKQPTFKINAYGGGEMRPASPWLPAPLVIDLSGAKSTEGAVALLDHDPTQIVGQATGTFISDSGIVIEGKITGDLADKQDPAAKVVMHARNGFKWKASIDGSIGRLERVEAGESVTVNGRSFRGPVYIARSSTIDGVSFVSIPADKSTSAAIAAKQHGVVPMDFHAWLKAKGFDPAALNEVQRDTLQKTYDAEKIAAAAAAQNGGANGQQGGNGQAQNGSVQARQGQGQNGAAGTVGDVGMEAVLAAARAKKARRDAITAECQRLAELHPNHLDLIEAQARVAVSEDWTADRFQLWAYRELPSNLMIDNRPRSRGGQADPRVVEAAVARNLGIADPEKHYGEQVMEASERTYRHGVGLQELLLISARANGVGDISTRDTEGLLRAAFPTQRLRADGPSTFDVSGILSNVGNKFIVQNFEAVDQAWSAVAATRPVNDFKQVSSYSLTGDMQYEEVAPGGELKHGKAAETAYTNQAKTYGKMFAVDRRDIINDDLNAFGQLMRRIGRGGALKLNEVFWAAFLDNTAFFTTGHGNFDSGSDTEFSLDSLTAAELLFATQTDPDGKPMAVTPRVLLVPSGYKRTAMAVIGSSTVVIAGTTDLKAPSANTFQGNFRVVSSPYMSNAALTGYSAKKWYLLADPNDLAVIEVAFLNGVQRPTVESAQADFNQLGIQFRGFFDFGVSKQEYRGGVAFKGES
jgi:hypothetical protein